MASRLLIDEPPLLVIPGLAKRVGLEGAIVLQQVHYFTNPDLSQTHFNGRHWVWKTYEQWVEMLPFWSKSTLQRVIRGLEEQNLLLVHKRKNKSFKTVKFYSINYEGLDQLLGERPPNKPSTPPSWGEELVKRDVRPCHPSPDTDINQTSSSPQEDSGHGIRTEKRKSFNSLQKKDFPRGGQIDHFEGVISNLRGGHPDPTHVVKMTSSFKDKITGKETLLPQRPSSEENQEEEDTFSQKNLKDFLGDMIDLWNITVQRHLKKPPVQLTHNRRQKLAHLWQGIMKQDLARWQTYCETIRDCRFLMGGSESAFCVTFDWALNVDNVVKILEGAIYDATPASDETTALGLPCDLPLQKPEDLGPDLSTDPQWVAFCEAIKDEIGELSFKSWFADVVPLTFSESKVTLGAPTSFMRDALERDWQEPIEKTLASLFSSQPKVSFVQATRSLLRRHAHGH